jgi:uncharacterized membrane protein
MGNLVVVGFDEPHKAEEARLRLQKLQSEYLLDLADVVVAINPHISYPLALVALFGFGAVWFGE